MGERRVAFFDIDKTIYDGYLIFPLAEHFLAEGIVGNDTVELLYRDLALYRSGREDYETTIANFNSHFALGLGGCTADIVFAATERLVEGREAGRFFAFAGPLTAMLGKTHDIYLVTGELQFVGWAVAKHFSVKGFVSSVTEERDGVFTGVVTRSLARKEDKASAIERLFKTYPRRGSMAFGDSEGDVEMLGRVEHAFCINATEGLARVALERKWNVVTPLSIIEAVRPILHGQEGTSPLS